MAEWYLLNHPRPARGQITTDVLAGEKLFHKVGCATCHVPDWHLPPHNPDAQGLHRSASTATAASSTCRSLQRQEPIAWKASSSTWPRSSRQASRCRGAAPTRSAASTAISSITTSARISTRCSSTAASSASGKTPPLWGVGQTAPYGHDGASLDLDAVIRRHGGEALDSTQGLHAVLSCRTAASRSSASCKAWCSTRPTSCRATSTATARSTEHFMVQGMDTGIERFNPEWLFRVPGKIEGPIRNVRGEPIVSHALTNVRAGVRARSAVSERHRRRRLPGRDRSGAVQTWLP